MSAHGARKGLSDTALRTADSGYLTRRLVDVSQDLIVREVDCCEGRDEISGMYVKEFTDGKEEIESLQERITGRFSCETIKDKDGNVIVKANHMITPKRAARVMKDGVDENGNKYTKIKIRTILSCKCKIGVCAKCYGANMATGEAVQVGESVGIIAAQSIGEPGTQLTMRTFHTGGVAGGDGGDITQGLPRVEELFEARHPKGVAVIAQITGEIVSIKRIDGTMRQEVIIKNETESVSHKINANQTLRPWVAVGQEIEAGQPLTEGPLDPKELLAVAGVNQVQNYILKEVKKVYQSQGIEISDKHLEVMIRQMMKKVIITDPGDTDLNVGVQLSLNNITQINRNALLNGKTPATFQPILLGISKSSVETDSFLSAASFQETTKVLTDATIKGKVDHLIGLKENVIIGKLIPAGTGCKGDRQQNEEVRRMAERLRAKRRSRQIEPHHDTSFEQFANVASTGSTTPDILMPETVEDQSVLENDSILNDPERFAEQLEHLDSLKDSKR